MPRLSDSMEEGTILKWLKADGDEVKRGEELAEIETDKATMTYEADADGTLAIVAQEGDTLPIGQVIATIGAGGGGDGAAPATGAKADATVSAAEGAAPAQQLETLQPENAAAQPAAAAPAAPPATPAPAPAAAPPSANGDGARVKASPVARRIARERGIDLAGLTGTGPGGRIVKADVEGARETQGTVPTVSPPAAPAPAPAPEPARETQGTVPTVSPPAAVSETGTAKGDVVVEELSRIQGVVARRMAESRATVPDFTLQIEVDMEACVGLRAQLKAVADTAPSYNDFVVKACAVALREFPRANGAYRDGRFELYSRVNVGVAVAAENALVVPTVFDADKKGLGTIARETRALAERVRAGVVTPPELSGGTFTVSNLGMFGITNFSAVINPPQAAILAVGAMVPRPVARDGEVVVRNVMQMTLACDHRILYGADAAQFFARIKALLEQPLTLAL
jgi:pyruvate dehydrogenase E2 component (dihydrolipoamide acetyltransferase)